MNGTIYIQIISLVYSFMLMIVYFSKKRLNTPENKVYKLLIIVNFVGIILDVICAVTTFNMVSVKTYNIIIAKLYLMYFITWIMAFSTYTFAISIKEEGKEEKIKKYLLIDLILFIIYTIIVFILPLEFVKSDAGMYAKGLAVNIVYFVVGIHIASCLVYICMNIRQIFSKKYVPLIVFLGIGVIIMYIQKSNPTLILIPETETFITILMYFTIENPDLKIIDELKKNRSLTSKNYIEKSNFLFRMSAEVRKPIENIKEINDYNIESNDIKEIKENSKLIDLNIRNATFTLNNVLDVTSLDSKKITITKDKKYDIKKLLNEIKLRESKKTNVRFTFNISDSLPQYLYGDAVRLKQVLMTIIEKSIERTKDGFIEINVDSINKYDVCRVIITLEDSSTPLSLEKINDVLSLDKEITNDDVNDMIMDINIVNKVINMMNGTLVIKSDVGNKLVIVLDSLIADFKKEDIVNDTDVLLVSNNEKLLKKLEGLFKDYSINTVMNGIDGIDLIKSGENYNLIIIDDEMKPISALETLKRLRSYDINIPMIVILDSSKEHIKHHYIKDGFTDYILKDDLNNEAKRIIKKML